MSSPFFSPVKSTSIASLPEEATIHFIGVAGVAMSQLAAECARRGFRVTGSDAACYPPADSVLSNAGITPVLGYARENVPKNVDLVVIGNAVSKGNEEVIEVERLRLPFTSFPQALAELLLDGVTHSIVVTGTHGKTTTSAACAYALSALGKAPRYFVGGVIPQLTAGLSVGTGDTAVFEGDEYDSGFFAKCAKFHFYKPTILIITSLEHDHADIYPTIDSLVDEFRTLLGSLSSGTPVIAAAGYPYIASLAREFPALEWIIYGSAEDVDIQVKKKGENIELIDCRGSGKESVEFHSRLSGIYNAHNLCASLLALECSGVSRSDIIPALSEFCGARRRQEVRFDGAITIVEDFAHHPRAVQETITAMRERSLDRRLVAVFEPRSHTSRRSYFFDSYVEALSHADVVVVQEVLQRPLDKKEELLDVAALVERVGNRLHLASGETTAPLAFSYPDPASVYTGIKALLRPGDVVLVMSNGSFGGLIEMLIQYGSDRYSTK